MNILNELESITTHYSNAEMIGFRQTFPDLDETTINSLYFSPAIASGLIYMDFKKRILFETKIFNTPHGFIFFKPIESNMGIKEYFKLVIEEYMNNVKKGNFDYLQEQMVPVPYQFEFTDWLKIKGYFLEDEIYFQGKKQPPRKTAVMDINTTIIPLEEKGPEDIICVIDMLGNSYSIKKRDLITE